MTDILHRFPFSLHSNVYYQRLQRCQETLAQSAVEPALRHECPKTPLYVNTCATKQHTILTLPRAPPHQVYNKYLLSWNATDPSEKWMLMESISHRPACHPVCWWSRFSKVPRFIWKLTMCDPCRGNLESELLDVPGRNCILQRCNQVPSDALTQSRDIHPFF